jgi:hypothetical protein
MVAPTVGAFTKRSADVRPPSRYRGSWLRSSMQTLRHRGHFDAYRTHLSESDRFELDALPTAAWIPARILMSHYAACDKLGLKSEELHAMGLETTRLAMGNSFRITSRAASGIGLVTPWAALDQFPKFWTHVADGGVIEVVKVHPKEAHVGLFAFPPARYAYNRYATRGIMEAALELFCQRVFVSNIVPKCNDDTLVFRIAWV